jgi:hypothetical protein
MNNLGRELRGVNLLSAIHSARLDVVVTSIHLGMFPATRSFRWPTHRKSG